jgi:D-alanine-D-alanine ligase
LIAKAGARVDLLQDERGNFYVIEINTVPGMTAHSNVPKSGSLLGFSYNDVVQEIINASL